MISLIRILLVFVVLTSAAPLVAVHAQEGTGVEDAAPATIPGLTITRNEAIVEFPDGITFSLDANSTDPIVNLELLYRAPGLETLSVELPQFVAGSTELDIEHAIDLRSGELPSGIDVQYHWRITEDDGDVVETPEQTLSWIDDRYEWTPLSGPNVTVYTYDADAAFQQEILDAAERTIGSLAESYGAELEQPVRVWAYADKDHLYGALAPNSEQWIAGAAFPGLHVIMAVLPPGDYDEVKRVVPHEISHQVLHQATNNPFNSPPQWLDEGLAVYWQESGRDRFYSYAMELAAAGQVPPLRTLNGTFPYDREGATAAYAFSLTAVMYILDTWGDEGMAMLLATFPEGITYEDAVQQGLGISFDELDRRWREDLLADAQQLGAAGSTRFSGDAPASPWATIGEGLALASGTVILGLVVLLAVIAGLVSLVRSRGQSDDDETMSNGVHWGEWPEGLEPPGWQARSP
ncbi:MAG TPA: peptidase MA family metallohydrolase [Thermomicrobiales bacterium]|nr:peptidase MA family metallohydrolase [Thermomicrobiales bacterium]